MLKPLQGLRLDSVAISSAVSACERSNQWTLALWTLGRSQAPRGRTSAAVACGQRGEWTWSLRLSQQPGWGLLSQAPGWEVGPTGIVVFNVLVAQVHMFCIFWAEFTCLVESLSLEDFIFT